MLDQTTKRKIDSARQILVGRIPVPQSQIEQITLALIYKFMNDTDKQSKAIGGKASFFTDDYERFSWDNIVDTRLTGQERMNLYTEGLERIARNPNIPELFRNVFKNAYLPFRDHQTLNMFLEEIDDFEYDNSEKLGDAYEYLLSIMSSQGDAGQFRTPRHIIDFIVSVVDPLKNERILDPACGTAGFLISAIKHIYSKNTKDIDGDLLNIDETQKIADNVVGYDISHEMVRISLVNMFLHKINQPHIYEYDTLTSTDKWEDSFNCILANPPFMSPKGGIRPHNKFGIPSSRSEVLFVDYIMEHLTLNGKAGIIVPEGIIFQSQGAYKELRRKMVEEQYLWAVVSLPAGVFNPYSGVKTSILFMDREIAQHTSDVLFIRIDADGFNLGAQRQPIEKNDLLLGYQVLNHYKTSLEILPTLTANGLVAHKVTKNVLKDHDYDLSENHYKFEKPRQGTWLRVRLDEICELYQPKTITQQDLIEDGQYEVYGANGIIGRYDKYNHEESEVLITCRGATCGMVNLSKPKSWVTGNAMVVTPKDKRISKEFLYDILKNTDLSSTISGSAQPQITRQGLAPFEIPLPPRDVQELIVAEIAEYQRNIDRAVNLITEERSNILNRINKVWEE